MIQIIYKAIYNPSLNYIIRNVNKFFSPFLSKKIRIPPSGIISISNSTGKKIKIKTNQTNYLTQLIFWDGYQNFEYTKIFISLIKKVSTFYDIGSNIGYYSLIASMENPEVKVIAFEPAKGPLNFLKENVELNKLNNIKIEPIALSNIVGQISFNEVKNKKYKYLKYNLAGTGSSEILNKGEDFFINVVNTNTLDNYYKVNCDQVDLIKIDTEGTEHLILQASKKLISETKPIIICETLYNTTEDKLEVFFKSLGYEFYNHLPKGLEKTISIKRKKDNGVRNCFFVHPSKFHLIQEFIV